jgi:hypothetical protein
MWLRGGVCLDAFAQLGLVDGRQESCIMWLRVGMLDTCAKLWLGCHALWLMGKT